MSDVAKLDLVKIDAEGHEKQIIEACAPHFQRLQPRAILFEDIAGDFPSISKTLKDAGYRTLGIEKRLMSLALGDPRASTHDYVAVSLSRQISKSAAKLLTWA